VLVVGATGTIGSAVAALLDVRHEVLHASQSRAPLKVDLADLMSIRALYRHTGPVDAVVCVAGQAIFRPLAALTDADLSTTIGNKLMGQVNLVRHGLEQVTDGGSFTLTSGMLGRHPVPGGVAIAMANSAVEAFVRAAALELPRGIRINAVAPSWVKETLVAMNLDPSRGTPVGAVAAAYGRAVEGTMTGEVLDVSQP
jgi:NAD(P)-dependent dehydrogenase (short-subunit alcohol dehydrogenase family)